MSRFGLSIVARIQCQRVKRPDIDFALAWSVSLLLVCSVLMCSCAKPAGNATLGGDGGSAAEDIDDCFRPKLSTQYGVLMRIKAEMIHPEQKTKLPLPSRIRVIECNGERMDPPVVLFWTRTPSRIHIEEHEIEDGATFDAIGYECVIMEGMPEGTEKFEELDGAMDFAYKGWNEWKVFVGVHVKQKK